MQSPINIVAQDPAPEASTPSNFQIDYKFENHRKISIKTSGPEMVVHFDDFAGGFKIEYGEGKMLSYAVKTMNFRFPAEHLINGYRLDGEIILKGEEVTENNNRVININLFYNLGISNNQWNRICHSNSI